MKKVITLIAVSLLSITMYAQDRIDAVQPTVFNHVSVLKNAKGWIYTEYDGKWFESKNRVHNIDDFANFTFSGVDYQGKRYLYLKKNYVAQGYTYRYIKQDPYSVGMHIDFLMSLEDYKDVISSMSTDGKIKLKLFYFGQDFPRGFLKENKYGDSHELVIRYRLYEKTARFLIYSLRSYDDSKEVWLEGLTDIDISEGQDLLKVIQNEDIFTKFYYECKLDDFLKFIKAPLNL